MSELSRRDFFLRFGHTVTDQIDPEKFQALVPEDLKMGRSHDKEEWVFVGTLSEMSPGARKRIKLGGKELQLEANEEGIWLSDSLGRRTIAIRLGSGGMILANLFSEWPRCRVLSQLSGEPKDLEVEHAK